jgi:polysaccharide biosynthesis PFTS motif protein
MKYLALLFRPIKIFVSHIGKFNAQIDFSSFKAFRKLRQTGTKCSDYTDIARKISIVELGLSNQSFWGLIPNSYGANLDRVLRQKILSLTLYAYILPALMRNANDGKPISIPAPKQWLNYLNSMGIEINTWGSRWLKIKFQIRCAYLGFRKSAQLIRDSYRANEIIDKNYSVLMNIPPNALPNLKRNKISGNGFINWYENSSLINLNDKIIIHGDGFTPKKINNTFRLTNKYYPRLENNVQRIKFIGRCLSILSVASVRAMFGTWWTLPLLEDAILLAYFETNGPSKIANSYVFNNSNWIVRPLWTYFAESCKSEVILIFYSTNMSGFKWKDFSSTPIFPSYEIMTWPIYAVWDSEQKTTLLKMNHNEAQYYIVGPVDMIDSCEKLPLIPKDAIGVFDVSIYKTSNLVNIGYVAAYYTAKMASDFLFGCHEAITKNGKTMVLKQKRNSGNSFHPIYARAIKKLSELDNVIIIDAEISARRLTNSVDATISVPFTSTALIGLHANKPSSYFDATSTLDPNASNARNLPVFDNVGALSKWIQNLPTSSI